MNALTKAIKAETNYTLTENGALTLKSTLSSLADFFGLGAALRSRSESEIINLFEKAFAEDKELAVRCLFYIRDCRGGQGERRVFRTILNWLGKHYPLIVYYNLNSIIEMGRWDDLFCLENTNAWGDALTFIYAEMLSASSKNKTSLLFKWLPSINTSSKETRRLARVLCKRFGMSEREYRLALSRGRANLALVESQMCANEWDRIVYEHVPSKAALNYRKAFSRHDAYRYNSYLQSVMSGTKKINATTLYPYEVVEKYLTQREQDNATLEALWKSLPDYLNGAKENALVVADVSGSMSGRPMAVSISLAMYIAERNKGAFHNQFLTFSSSPELQSIVGATLSDRIRNLSRANWDMNTDLQKTFDLILNSAIKHKVPASDMPRALYIISDMEFDQACGYGNATNFEAIKEKYARSGYELPQLIFWNVNARNNQSPVRFDEKGTCLVSGCSPSILKATLARTTMTSLDVMLDVLNGARYQKIKV